MKTLLAACTVALSVTIPAWAQQPATQTGERHFVLENTQIIPVQSQSTGRAHELVVVLPSSYATHPEKRYPVLYYLDAYWDTPLLTATYGNLIYDNQVPEFIMVGRTRRVRITMSSAAATTRSPRPTAMGTPARPRPSSTSSRRKSRR
jgi:predicted alpha/beta superfamily hydrolase